VRVDVTGVRLDVAPGDIIECRVPPYEPEWGIRLARKAALNGSRARCGEPTGRARPIA